MLLPLTHVYRLDALSSDNAFDSLKGLDAIIRQSLMTIAPPGATVQTFLVPVTQTVATYSRTLQTFRNGPVEDSLWKAFTDAGGKFDQVRAVSGLEEKNALELSAVNGIYTGNDHSGCEYKYFAVAILARVVMEDGTHPEVDKDELAKLIKGHVVDKDRGPLNESAMDDRDYDAKNINDDD